MGEGGEGGREEEEERGGPDGDLKKRSMCDVIDTTQLVLYAGVMHYTNVV